MGNPHAELRVRARAQENLNQQPDPLRDPARRARALADRLGIPTAADLARRTGERDAQKDCDALRRSSPRGEG